MKFKIFNKKILITLGVIISIVIIWILIEVNSLYKEYENIKPMDLKIVKNLIENGNESIPELQKMLKEGTTNRKIEALGILCRIRTDKAISLIIEALNNEDDYTRIRASEILAYLKNPVAIDPLINMFIKENDKLVKLDAAKALLRFNMRIGYEFVVKCLKDKDWFIVLTAIEVHSLIDDEESIDNVLHFADHKEDIFREGLAKILYRNKIQTKKVTSVLRKLLKDSDKSTQLFAAMALLKRDYKINPEIIYEYWNDENILVRLYAIEALGYLKGDRKAIGILEEAQKDKDELIRAAARKFLKRISVDKNP